jgi:hypothetical protein
MSTDESADVPHRDLAISDVMIDAVAVEIRQHAAAAKLAFACTVGQIVLERFFRGDIDAWRGHGHKDVSLRRLAERLGEANLSASNLSRCVAIHCALSHLGPLTQWRCLTPKHVCAVLSLPEPERSRLLREADEQGWSAPELRRIAYKGSTAPRRGRPSIPTFARAIRQLCSMLRPNGAAFQELDRASTLDDSVILTLNQDLMQAREQLERLQRVISPKRIEGITAGDRPKRALRDRGVRRATRPS